MGDFVTLEIDSDKRVGLVQLQSPPVNAIAAGIVDDLDDITQQLEGNSDVRAVVLWGGPKIFAAGADIKNFPSFGHAEARDFSVRLNTVFSAFGNLSQISISAVNGYALGGGCELAMSTDFRIAGERAVFGQPEILLGLIPGAGGTQRLARLVGVTKAKEIVYSGRQVEAAEAVDIGLASSVHPDGEVLDTAVELAAGYAAGPAALEMAKRAIDRGYPLPLADALEVETEEFARSFETEDCTTGVASFLADGPGKAEFSGR